MSNPAHILREASEYKVLGKRVTSHELICLKSLSSYSEGATASAVAFKTSKEIAIAAVHVYLKRLVKKGLSTVEQVTVHCFGEDIERKVYKLTDIGFALCKYSAESEDGKAS